MDLPAVDWWAGQSRACDLLAKWGTHTWVAALHEAPVDEAPQLFVAGILCFPECVFLFEHSDEHSVNANEEVSGNSLLGNEEPYHFRQPMSMLPDASTRQRVRFVIASFQQGAGLAGGEMALIRMAFDPSELHRSGASGIDGLLIQLP